jgi:hypothetical protein
MYRSLYIIFFIFGCIFCTGIAASAQTGADEGPIFGKRREPEAKNVREMLFKMQIDKEKKDYEEMLDRGQQALVLSQEIEKTYEKTGSLTSSEREKLNDVEKLVKKIRGELGGEDGDAKDPSDDTPKDIVDGVKYLADSTGKLVDELKKTTRFSISAAAIESSNSVLKVIRYLRFNDK